MGGTYWKLANDGAGFRCRDCDMVKPHSQVILFEHTETKQRQLVCVECVDQDWLKEATCLGTL
jgi:hypothetical protein